MATLQVPSAPPGARPCVAGKFLCAGGSKLSVRGVTYGTFRGSAEFGSFPEPACVARDFALMTRSGINAIRTYTTPPLAMFDLAESFGLRILAGLAWEQHVAFLDDRARCREIRRRVREASREVQGHPALLGVAIGNEIPAGIVRWHGRRPIAAFLRELYGEVKGADPGALVTYVNYPSTEHLELPFLDFQSFNVYLESSEDFAAYLARLQNLAGERPLVMAEIGLDSRRNGVEAQARAISWQVRRAFEAGCAGTFVFAWTDEWHRGGHEVEDWDFGLTTRDRDPKPALKAVREAYAAAPVDLAGEKPLISVVVCSYNGAATIRDTLEATAKLDYPNYEVIVVDDGSTDSTASIAAEYDVRLIRTRNQGLSAARNVGLAAARGAIVAYTDDDAYPDPDWLSYLAVGFSTSDHVGIGGPNLLPPEDGRLARCVYHSPGGPHHVLLSDREAEHIPGCNMAFRRESLEAIGGFDPRFRTAGDDVDVCWRLRDRGWTLGFHPAACVWHHRRPSVRAYWRQQVGYGRAEAELGRKWPQHHNGFGHTGWSGRIYGPGLPRYLGAGAARVYQGTWGTAPFQSIYEPSVGGLAALPRMPEWLLVVALLAVATAAGSAWPALRWCAIPLLLAAAIPVVQALRTAAAVPLERAPGRYWIRAVIAVLHLVQPAARLWGRLRGGAFMLTAPDLVHWSLPRRGRVAIWRERWQPPHHWLARLETRLEREQSLVRRGGDWDRWDLEVQAGLLGRARVLLAVEEHGSGRQYLHFRLVPRLRRSLVAALLLGLLAGSAALDAAVLPAGLLAAGSVGLAGLGVLETGVAMGRLRGALAREGEPEPEGREP